MTITYQATHPGVKLPTAITAIEKISIDNKTFRGYFSKADLMAILKDSDCVGIRIYNIDPSVNNFRLIAVGLKKDGTELSNYFLSFDSRSKLYDQAAQQVSKRIAMAIAEGGKPFDKTLFASYFSKDMIKELLHDDASKFDGIALYEVELFRIEDEDLPIHMKGHIGVASNTHIGVASNIKEGVVELNPHPESHNVLSDTPCSGHSLITGMTCAIHSELFTKNALSRFGGGGWG